MNVLSVRHLRKEYGPTVAVRDLSFEIQRGEIVGLLGPNGAGKSTTINMILGILEPSAGAVRIEDVDLAADRARALAHTNFAAVYSPLPGNLTVEENLEVFGLLYGLRRGSGRVGAVVTQFDLERFRRVKAGLLSSGEQTRLGLAKAFLNDPHLLLLDEPTASLDPAAARDVRSKIRRMAAANQAGVLWTSHNMAEVEEVCDRVVFLSRGKRLLEGDPKTLPAEHGKKSLEDLFISVAREPLTLGES